MADSIPLSPQTWVDVPMGVGQEPSSPFGHIQSTPQGDPIRRTDVRRKPGYETLTFPDARPEKPV